MEKIFHGSPGLKSGPLICEAYSLETRIFRPLTIVAPTTSGREFRDTFIVAVYSQGPRNFETPAIVADHSLGTRESPDTSIFAVYSQGPRNIETPTIVADYNLRDAGISGQLQFLRRSGCQARNIRPSHTRRLKASNKTDPDFSPGVRKPDVVSCRDTGIDDSPFSRPPPNNLTSPDRFPDRILQNRVLPLKRMTLHHGGIDPQTVQKHLVHPTG